VTRLRADSSFLHTFWSSLIFLVNAYREVVPRGMNLTIRFYLLLRGDMPPFPSAFLWLDAPVFCIGLGRIPTRHKH
jgi:hypothetical protein